MNPNSPRSAKLMLGGFNYFTIIRRKEEKLKIIVNQSDLI